MPQLTVVEMLLADASEKLNTGQLELGCQMIAQAASLLDQVGLPTPEALVSVPMMDIAPPEVAPIAVAEPEPPRAMAAAA